MTTQEIEAIRRRLEAATPGPWRYATIVTQDERYATGPQHEGGVGAPSEIKNKAHADALLIAHAPTDLRALLDEVERLRGIQPDMGPRAPDGEGLPRYGLRWNGPTTPLSVPMDDGYWTPWHLANAEAERQREEVFAAVDAALDRFDCTCGRDDYRHRTSALDGHNPTRCNICNGDPCPKCALDYALRDAR